MEATANRQPGIVEFIVMIALTMSLVALAIDALLPAHGVIGAAYNVKNANDTQYIVYCVFAGLGIGQFLYGPAADAHGRRPVVLAGLALFAVGTLCAAAAPSYPVLLLGRFLQGLGVAGPRIITVAVVRDRYVGRQMARVMSFVMTVFILVPAIAPSIGQAIIDLAGWRSIFSVFLIMAVVIAAWFLLRQGETLDPLHRQPLSLQRTVHNFGRVLGTPVSMGYLLAATLVSAPFVGFLGTAQQLLGVQYGLGDQFPTYFALLAAAVGVSTLINGTFVVRLGMRALAQAAAVGMTVIAAVLLWQGWSHAGQPPLGILMACLCATFFFIGFLFGNLNALAMEPLGHIAGTAASLIGALTTLGSAAIGTLIGSVYDGTVMPLAASFTVFGVLNLVTLLVTARLPAPVASSAS